MACRLRNIRSRRVDAFRRALRGDLPARVEPMRVRLKPQAQAVKARPRRYDPVKTGWLASCITALVAFVLIVRNIQAVRASPAMAVPKKGHFPFGRDYQAVNSQVEQTPKMMTDLLRDLDSNVCVDDVFYVAEDEVAPLCLLDEIIGRLESVAVHSPCDADDSLPSVDVIRAAQRKACLLYTSPSPRDLSTSRMPSSA